MRLSTWTLSATVVLAGCVSTAPKVAGLWRATGPAQAELRLLADGLCSVRVTNTLPDGLVDGLRADCRYTVSDTGVRVDLLAHGESHAGQQRIELNWLRAARGPQRLRLSGPEPMTFVRVE